MRYCVYYIHTETFIILAAFLFQIVPKFTVKLFSRVRYKNKASTELALSYRARLASLILIDKLIIWDIFKIR